LAYEEYLAKIIELTKRIKDPTVDQAYPASLDSPAKRALFDNMHHNEPLAVTLDLLSSQMAADRGRRDR
jgi:type I restriction enzyme, R subunit